jgi:hypothetical protein
MIRLFRARHSLLFAVAITWSHNCTTAGVEREERPAPEVEQLVSFLNLLAEEHVTELRSQLSGRPVKETASRQAMIRDIVNRFQDEPDTMLTLNADAHFQKQDIPEMETGQVYMLGYPGDSYWVKNWIGEGSDRRFYLSLPHNLPVRLRLFFCNGRFVVSQEFSFEETLFVIPNGVTIVTPCTTVRFPRGLSMQRGAQLLGTHECGFTVIASSISGGGGNCGGWPIISTSIRRSIPPECLQQFALVGDPLFRLSPTLNCVNLRKISGDNGEIGANAVPLNVVGSPGVDGDCNTFCIPPTTFPSPGEDVVGPGTPGGDGGDGSNGMSTRVLRVEVQQVYGSFRFITSAGDGGNGGWGGRGQTLIGGRGGHMKGECKPCVGSAAPGRGGNAGPAGRGGNGGRGGDGGMAGDIHLDFPAYATEIDLWTTNPIEEHFAAIASGGFPGCGGARGDGGVSFGGALGCWKVLDLFGGGLDCPGEPPALSGVGQGRAPEGTDGNQGVRGLNGRIYLNGIMVRGTDEQRRSAFWADYTWPYDVLGRQACASRSAPSPCPHERYSIPDRPPPLISTRR